MSHYRKIDVRIWNDAKFQSLPDGGKLAFLMLLTHPMMTALGAMRGTPDGLAAELGTDPKAFREAFRDILAKGMAEHDEKACLIALPNFLKYNSPESPNVVRGWAKVPDFLPECPLKTLVIQRAVAFAKGMSKAFAEAIPEDLPLSESREQRTEILPNQGGNLSRRGTTGGKRLALVKGAANGGEGF